jgi:hypothetical protein
VIKLRWPPRGVGLDTPLNSALSSKEDRARFARSLWQFVVIGMATAATMIGLDQILFAGVSLQRIRALGVESVWLRSAVVVYSAITEEVIYRLGICSLVAWVAWVALARVTPAAKSISMWGSIVVGAVLFSLAHVSNVTGIAHPYARAFVLNGVAGLVLGWLYWKKGIEAAVVAHLAGDAFIYLGLASVL